MWLATKFGFFSIVYKEGSYHVRAREKTDLEELLRVTEIRADVQTWPNADYRYRTLITSQSDLSRIFQVLSESIDYNNFKNAIGDSATQKKKLKPYLKIWQTMYEVQE
ncbi:MAG: hypothetical protein KDK38_13745 [Leptospiraceae bacterium]|nr:hypothetical protein [Leptospiraceae bacterium]